MGEVKSVKIGELSAEEVEVVESQPPVALLLEAPHNYGSASVTVITDDTTYDDQVVSSVLAQTRVAPALRVEKLRDDDHSSYCGSDSEEGAQSHGDLSDQDLSRELDEEFQPPSDELRDRVIKQVEFYFSDANILKDAFLLKHVRRNKQGYVSLKLITSFRKVKSITKDYRIVAYSLRQTDKLDVNEEGTKVRRKDPLPDHDETTPSRTVVAVNLPIENPTMENVAELFSKSGEIVLIRILRPGKAIPQDVKKHMNKHPEIGTTICAIVEFENHDSAKLACEALTNKEDWRKGSRVMLLSPPKKEKGNKDRRNGDVGSQDESPDKNKDETNQKKKRRDKRQKRNSRVDELASDGTEPVYSSGSDAEQPEMWERRGGSAPQIMTRASLSPKPDVNRLSPSTTPRTTPRSSPMSSPRTSPRSSPNLRRRSLHGKSPLASDLANSLSPGTSPRPSPAGSPETRRRKNSRDSLGGELGTSPSQSPWVQRRLKAQQESIGKPGVATPSPVASPRLGRRNVDGKMEGIMRLPKGPDGTKGFGKGRGKVLIEEVAA